MDLNIIQKIKDEAWEEAVLELKDELKNKAKTKMYDKMKLGLRLKKFRTYHFLDVEISSDRILFYFTERGKDRPISFSRDLFLNDVKFIKNTLCDKIITVCLKKGSAIDYVVLPKIIFAEKGLKKRDRRIKFQEDVSTAVSNKLISAVIERNNIKLPEKITLNDNDIERSIDSEVLWTKDNSDSTIAEAMISMYVKNLGRKFNWCSAKTKFSKFDFITENNTSIDIKTLDYTRHRLIIPPEKTLDNNLADIIIHTVLKKQGNSYVLHLNGWISRDDFKKFARYEPDFPRPGNPAYILENSFLKKMDELCL